MANVEILYASPYAIHALIRENGEPSWVLSCIYASPNEKKRDCFWECFKTFAKENFLPWVLIGGFNDIAENSEKMGGSSRTERRCRILKQHIWDLLFCIDLHFLWPEVHMVE